MFVVLQAFEGVASLPALALFALVGLTFVAAAVYVGVLRALDVYFDEEQDSVFLSDSGPPR